MKSARYIAEISDVQEVLLQATANLDYWRDHLRAEELIPFNVEGRAELLIGAMQSKWSGIRFREFTVALAASRQADGSTRDGMYLVAAGNSSRLFTFCERVFFHTPYRHERIDVRLDPPAFCLGNVERPILRAAMSETLGTPRILDEHWEGAIFLPGRKQFFARLAGETHVYPFNASTDLWQLHLHSSGESPFVRALLDCDLIGRTWHVRRRANHARSKTYARNSL